MIADRDLMTLFSEMTAWTNYTATGLAQAEVEETRAEAEVRYQEAILFVKAPSSAKVTVTKAEMATVKPVAEARQRHLEAYAQRKLANVMYSNCERIVALISRELTRRVGRENTERRSLRWNP